MTTISIASASCSFGLAILNVRLTRCVCARAIGLPRVQMRNRGCPISAPVLLNSAYRQNRASESCWNRKRKETVQGARLTVSRIERLGELRRHRRWEEQTAERRY